MTTAKYLAVLGFSFLLNGCLGIEWDLGVDDIEASIKSDDNSVQNDQPSTMPHCGDGICHLTENADLCEADCSACGNGQCNANEDAQNCPSDCDTDPVDDAADPQDDVDASTDISAPADHAPPVNEPICGHGDCADNESTSQCPADCAPDEPQPNPAEQVIGFVDHVSLRNGEWVVGGWACHVGWAPSVEVEVYAGGDSTSGTSLFRALADAAQEDAVGQACGVAAGQHRFQLPFTQAQLEQFAGDAIFVHAISPVGNENRALVHSGDFSLPNLGPDGEPLLPFEFNDVTWLHTNVSQWPVTTTLSVSFQGGTICLEYDKKDVWPPVAIPHNSGDYDIDVVANPWVFLEHQGQWYAGTWEWLVVGATCKNMSSVAGDHIKQPAHIPLDWRPTSGQRLYFMVSGLARFSDIANTQERSQIVEVIWP